MGLKQQLLDAVKASIPTFDEENDFFIIEFEAGADSFGSFTHFDTDAKGWEDYDINLDEHLDLIVSILNESDIEYHFVGAQMLGKIIYSNQTLELQSEYLIDGADEEDEDDPNEGWKFDYKILKE